MRITIRLDEQDSATLKQRVAQTGQSAADLVRQAFQHRYRRDEMDTGAPPEPRPTESEPAPPETGEPSIPEPTATPQARERIPPPTQLQTPKPFDHGVGVRILSVPLDPVTGLYDDGPLQRFLADKQLIRIEPVFVAQGGTPHWTVWVQYLPQLSRAEQRVSPQSTPLSEADQRLLERLKQWRKQRAEQDGVPVFVVATNRELEDLVRRKPRSPAALQQVRGFGGKKIKRYGAEILVLLQPDRG